MIDRALGHRHWLSVVGLLSGVELRHHIAQTIDGP